jgi:hypothetical protein
MNNWEEFSRWPERQPLACPAGFGWYPVPTPPDRACGRKRERREAMITTDWLRPHIKKANEEGANIVASGDGKVEWRGRHMATVDECPGGVIVAFDNKTVTACTEEQLSQVLLVIGRELITEADR